MGVKEEEGDWLSACVTIFLGGTLKLFMSRVVSETFAAPFG